MVVCVRRQIISLTVDFAISADQLGQVFVHSLRVRSPYFD